MENPGKLYLADQRGLIENSSLKRHCTFNFERFFNEHKAAFKNLFICNDDFIAPGKLNFYLAKENSLHLFIPIAGSINMVAKNKEFFVETKQVQLLSLEKGEVLEISNSHKDEVVNYLHLAMVNDDFIFFKDQLFSFDLENNKNKMVDVIANYRYPFKLSTGLFKKGEEVVYKLHERTNSLFSFTVSGSFQIEGRMTNARDGIALWDTESINIKALDNDAFILTIELFA
ncbi:hypothetical protein QWY86_02395 [Pedobacter aquatilis]|uniref:pirin family protein n=1 Tax=Pedobacter aquatilis TaxID=351343 RepID=UPI0025B31F9A|nr:hypothetical protein [Pedobacter aquatilis]MDN3585501.1 hypothetical protein [Pedobacter aquatilis]